MNTPTLRKKLHDWHNQSSRAVRSLPGVGSLPSYSSTYFGPLSNLFGDMERMVDHTWRAFGMPLSGFVLWE